MAMISSGVGFGGANRRMDVMTVQQLLKAKGYDPGPIDGICGARTIDAIRRLQGGLMARPDGLISPGLQTWQRLNGAGGASSGGARSPTPGGLPGGKAAPPAPATVAANWSGDPARWPQEQKLRSLTAALRPKVEMVLAALVQRQFQPTIFYGWRSVAVQLELYKAGNSQVQFSFHNAQKPDGTPNSYAADIIDSRYAWNKEAESSGFWKALGEEAKKQGLYWGGDWSGFRDWAHVQLVANAQLAQVKRDSGL